MAVKSFIKVKGSWKFPVDPGTLASVAETTKKCEAIRKAIDDSGAQEVKIEASFAGERVEDPA